MSKIKAIKQQFELLDDLKKILTAMKGLAYAETKKLSRYLADQGRVMSSLRELASDFLSFYPLVPPQKSSSLIVVFGSERGLCGNFNEQVLSAAKNELEHVDTLNQAIIAVGGRISSKLERITDLTGSVKGATCAEEIPEILCQLCELIGKLSDENAIGFLRVKIIAHQENEDKISILEPLEEFRKEPRKYGSPPVLTLAPAIFFQGLLRTYLQSLLIQTFYSSLLAENVKRIRHLDGAIDKLERNTAELRLRYNQARQEDITEEIEILMTTTKTNSSKR